MIRRALAEAGSTRIRADDRAPTTTWRCQVAWVARRSHLGYHESRNSRRSADYSPAAADLVGRKGNRMTPSDQEQLWRRRFSPSTWCGSSALPRPTGLYSRYSLDAMLISSVSPCRLGSARGPLWLARKWRPPPGAMKRFLRGVSVEPGKAATRCSTGRAGPDPGAQRSPSLPARCRGYRGGWRAPPFASASVPLATAMASILLPCRRFGLPTADTRCRRPDRRSGCARSSGRRGHRGCTARLIVRRSSHEGKGKCVLTTRRYGASRERASGHGGRNRTPRDDGRCFWSLGETATRHDLSRRICTPLGSQLHPSRAVVRWHPTTTPVDLRARRSARRSGRHQELLHAGHQSLNRFD